MGYLHTGTTLLAEAFLSRVRRFEKDKEGRFDCPADYKARIFYEAEHLLRLGISATRMLDLCQEAKEADQYVYSLIDFMKDKGILIPSHYRYEREADECIRMGAFYFHPELQEVSQPGRTVIDWETMEMKVEPAEPFFLEIRDSFTLQDVVRYFLQATEAEDELNTMKRLTGQFRTAVERYGLDLTLYLIDAGVSDAKDEGRRTPRTLGDLMDTIELARTMYGNRKSICWEGGLDHVQPRKRDTDPTTGGL